MHLERMRIHLWNSLWKPIAKKYLNEIGPTTLADQDIYNAFISTDDNVKYFYDIPCKWNFQLAKNKLKSTCNLYLELPKIVHWNTVPKPECKF